MSPRNFSNPCAKFENTPQADDDIFYPSTAPTASSCEKESTESCSSLNTLNQSATLINADTLYGRRKSATLTSGQKIFPAALILLHQAGPIQAMLAKNWFTRLGFKPIFIEKTTTDMAIAALNKLQVPLNHVIQVVLVELNYSTVGSPEPNFTLLKALTTSEKIKPQFIIASSFTPVCSGNPPSIMS
jgi:hypothetical protein